MLWFFTCPRLFAPNGLPQTDIGAIQGGMGLIATIVGALAVSGAKLALIAHFGFWRFTSSE